MDRSVSSMRDLLLTDCGRSRLNELYNGVLVWRISQLSYLFWNPNGGERRSLSVENLGEAFMSCCFRRTKVGFFCPHSFVYKNIFLLNNTNTVNKTMGLRLYATFKHQIIKEKSQRSCGLSVLKCSVTRDQPHTCVLPNLVFIHYVTMILRR